MKARELLFTCEQIDADQAEHIGLVNKVVPADELDREVTELAAKIIKNSQASIRAIKSSIKQGMKVDLETGLKIEANVYREFHEQKHEAKETEVRLRAFVEKNAD